ncbi:MAG TPA: FAD-dependent monooxygenase [Streptosporangiaceae bacterium]|nr:FAD-dependent monooxygenase [Streptosporangiaceae bacterium]
MAISRVIGTSVAIVGGGPVGLALATALGQAGIRCVLMERQLTPSAVPKGQNLSARSLEHFHFWGCAGELHAARLLPAGFPIGGITAYEDLASEYWYAPAGRETVADFYYERNERLPQYLTEAVLRGRVRELESVTPMFGWSVTGVKADGGGARVTAVHAPDGERCEIEAGYVVGCDGAHSAVRDRAGIGSGGSDFDQRMVLAVFRSPELDARLGRFPLRTTYRVLHPALKGYWWFFGRVDAADTWFFHAPVRKDAVAENFDVHALIERATGAAVSCAFEHVGFWDLRIDIADAYRRGRVFIAGDAAHSHPPYGAHGLNTGLEDAVNLGWKLAAVLQGWGGPFLLDSYEQERRPVFAETGEVIADGIARDRAFLERYSPRRDRREFELAWSGMTGGETAPPWYEPHYEGSPIVWGPAGSACSVRGQHAFEARAGHHLAPAVLSSGRNVFEELPADAFSLLALAGGQEAAEPFQAAAGALRIPLTVIGDTADDARAAYRRRFILVRPDQYVAWAADDLPADPAAVLRRAAGSVAAG